LLPTTPIDSDGALAVNRRRDRNGAALGDGRELVPRQGAVHPGAGDDDRPDGVGQHQRRRPHVVPGRRRPGGRHGAGVRGRAQRPRRDRLVQDVLGNDDDDRPWPAGDGSRYRLGDGAGDVVGPVHHDVPLGHRGEQRDLVDLGQRAGAPAAPVNVGGDDQQRHPSGAGLTETADDIGGAAAAGHLHDAQPVADPRVGVGHGPGMTLVPGQHVPQPVLAGIQRVVENDSGIARHAEESIDASRDEGLGEKVGAPEPADRLGWCLHGLREPSHVVSCLG
jgi:hypothetical protein